MPRRSLKLTDFTVLRTEQRSHVRGSELEWAAVALASSFARAKAGQSASKKAWPSGCTEQDMNSDLYTMEHLRR